MDQKDRYISTVLGVKVDRTLDVEVLKIVEKWLSEQRKRYIVTVNVEMVMLAQKDEEFLKILNGADLSLADGWGLRLADRKLNCKLPGAQMMLKLIRLAQSKSKRVMLVGGKEGVAQKAATILRQRFNYQKIKGISGPADVSKSEATAVTVKRVNAYAPDFLLVGFGHGKQEKWIVNNLGKLKIKVAMGVGGAFDQLVDPSLKAPEWMAQHGLEWLYRLIREPKRISRQWVLVKYVGKLLLG